MTKRRDLRTGALAVAWLPLAIANAVPARAQDAGQTPAPPALPTGEEEADTTAVKPYFGNINPFYGNISPFWGNITPFYGNITPFWGNINPFYGNITPFWGNINPFIVSGQVVAPAWGNIQPFWQTVGAKWQAANAMLNVPSLSLLASPNAQSATQTLRDIVKLSEATWGAAVTAKTGRSFTDGFAAPLLAKYAIDLSKPATLAALSPGQRAEFFQAWYDGLMNFSGRDRVDHWMVTANWNPALTQQQGSGSDTVIGVIDGNFGAAADLTDRLVQYSGRDGFAGGHGAGVASLLVAAHDGEGVMGIAPRASVVLHNPFDASGTANWADVREGILALKSRNASIVNASLGEAGTVLPKSWNAIFGSAAIAARKADTVYVIAAGNEGLTQTRNIEWGRALGTNFLLVGSVDPAGNISSFSNRPGTACLLVNGACSSSSDLAGGGLLMNRFITAPGELILVADGMGGTVRRSGTSFAAPLVSGAIALLHDRWPWLAKDPAASVEIILRSAKDLGAKGVDPVYGVGMLDVAASQSPLDFSKLVFYKVKGSIITGESAANLQLNGVQLSWEADGVYFTLFEKVGNSTRDFIVPMSSLVRGQIVSTFGNKEFFQHFLTQRLTDFIGKKDGGQFTDVASYTSPDRGGWQMSVASQNPIAYLTGQSTQVPHSAFRAAAPGGAFSVTAGRGVGALALTGQRGFGMMSDFNGEGGVNPLLAMASGGSFFASEIALAPRTGLSFGYTERSLSALDDLSRLRADTLFSQSEKRRAHAFNVRVNHDFAPGTGFSLAYTSLREDDALLAVQAQNDLLEQGSRSDALTLGGTAELGSGISFAASASAGRSRTAIDSQLATEGAGLLTSAYAVAATKNGVIGRADRLRLSFAQAMHVESGRLALKTAQILDRATGEVGVAKEGFAIDGGARVHTAELLYAAPVQEGRGELSLFGRATMGAQGDYRTGFASGVRLRLEM